MKRPIVCDPKRFGGEPHIEGTTITVAEVQAYWRQPGVCAKQIRERYPELSEAELGVAVTYAEQREPQFSWVADSAGRRLRLYSEPPGWRFVVDGIADDGEETPGWDTWEETWERILLYTEEHAPKQVIWREVRSGERVCPILCVRGFCDGGFPGSAR